MSRWEVWQNGMCVVMVDGPGAERSALHYLMVYAEDGPAELFEIMRGKRVKRAELRRFRTGDYSDDIRRGAKHKGDFI